MQLSSGPKITTQEICYKTFAYSYSREGYSGFQVMGMIEGLFGVLTFAPI